MDNTKSRLVFIDVLVYRAFPQVLSCYIAFLHFTTISSIILNKDVSKLRIEKSKHSSTTTTTTTTGTTTTTLPPSLEPLEFINSDRTSKGWARFCEGQDQFDFYSDKCEAGIWWRKDVLLDNPKWDCICTRGPWRWSSSWCSSDNSQRYTQNDLTCFTPESYVEGLFYLGDPLNIEAASEPLLLTSYTSGMILGANDFYEPWKVEIPANKDVAVLIHNPDDDWSVTNLAGSNITLCLRLPELGEVSETRGLFVYNVSMLYDEYKLDHDMQGMQVAFKKGCTDFNKGVWFEVNAESIYDKNMVIPSFDKASATDACLRCSRNIPDTTSNLKKRQIYDPKYSAIQLPETSFLAPDLQNSSILSQEVNLQSERIGLYWAKRLFRNETDFVEDNLQEIDILIKAAVMAYGTCDMNYIPKHFYQYFLLMLRKLLSESFQKYSPMAPIPDNYYDEINNLLQKCTKRVKPITFKGNGECPMKYVTYIMNNSKEVSTEPPEGYRASPQKHDYLLEFVWKLKEFLSYNCFFEFEQNSFLHDLIQTQLEDLFTEDILLKWTNPGKAFEMYTAIFKSQLNLESTMFNFEGCVKAVHDSSRYETWLKRPIEQPNRNRTKRSIRRVSTELESKSRIRRSADVTAWSAEDTEYDDEESLEAKRTERQMKDVWGLAQASATCLSKIDTFMIAVGFRSSACW